MKNSRKPIICAVSAALALTAAASFTASAAVSDKCGGMNMAVANVSDALLIRSAASSTSEVLGYLPSAAGVVVESMNNEWTKVKSGSISGYVKTDYLAFGEKADELLSVYGVPGAVAAWDDVKIFSDLEDTSSIIGTINTGEGFEVLGSSENWVEIQLASGDIGYVPAEDVEMTLVLDTAVDPDAYEETAQEAYDETYDDYSGAYAQTYTDYGYADPYAQYDTGYTVQETEAAYAWDPYGTEYAQQPQTEAVTADNEVEEITDEDLAEDFNDGITGDEYVDLSQEEAAANVSSSDLDLLAALIYCEAGNQSQEGKIAVGQVVMNRVASSSFANSIHDVIYESGQFTPAGSGWLDQVIGSAPQDCYDAALAAMNGEGTVGGALYFNGGTGKGIQLGDHQFY